MTTIEFELKEYLGEEFGKIHDELKKIETNLEAHRKTEDEIKTDLTKLNTHFRWLLGILSPVGTSVLIIVVKILFFS